MINVQIENVKEKQSTCSLGMVKIRRGFEKCKFFRSFFYYSTFFSILRRCTDYFPAVA